MRIDQNIPALVSQQNKSAEKTAKRAEDAVRQDGGGATLSLSAAAVSSLTGPNAAPEIRHERVQALKAAVDNNTYKPRADKIADSMLSSLANWR